jgi:hypothetical protein
MRAFIRNSMILSVLVGVAAAVGCSSSDNSSGAGGSAGTLAGEGGESGAASGGTTNGGSAGEGSVATAGALNGGAADGGAANGGAADGGAANVGADAGAAGLAETAGAGGAVSAACNSVVQAAPSLTETSTTTLPVLAQGTIQAGTYYLTSLGIHANVSGVTLSTAPYEETVVVTVSGNTATLNEISSSGGEDPGTSTMEIVMGAPTTAAPTSIIAKCSQNDIYDGVVGQELKTILSYGVTGDTLTLLIAGTDDDIVERYALQH